MYWRQTRTEFERFRGQENREALKSLVDGGKVPGILAYSDDQPIGWVSVGPREDFRALERSRILKPVDDQPVWSVVCFFVARSFRHRGLTVELLKAAASYAGQRRRADPRGVSVRAQVGTARPVRLYGSGLGFPQSRVP
jgi:GNAT superfamily N-acetyltransferase